jgi:polar amino acid transport system substrate-binding protein
MVPKLLRAAMLAALAVLTVGFAGCGSSSKSSSSSGGASSAPSAPKSDPKVAALVPAKVKSKGTLTVAADASYAPNEFIKPGSKTIQGTDVDLANALGGVMGVKVNVVNATFDAIIPGLAAGKYDLGLSSFTDNREREKTVDFVTYFTAGTSFYVKAQGGAAIGSVDALCGHKVAVEKGTVQADDAAKQGKKCKSTGKGAVSVLVFPDQNGANLALSSGRADAVMADSPVAAYAVKQSAGQFKLQGAPYDTAPYGIAIPKNSGLAKPLLAALKTLITNGQYTSILKKWGVQDGAITNPAINGATS